MRALVSCTDLAAYHAAAADADGIPFLVGAGRSPAGLPEDLVVRNFDERAAGRRLKPLPADRHRLCLSHPDPTCRLAARLLCERTGRQLHEADSVDEWAESLELALRRKLHSLTVFAPLWAPDACSLDPLPVERAVDIMRTAHARGHIPPAGIMTAPDPSGLSRLVAKAILQDEVRQAYADSPGALFLTGPEWRPPPLDAVEEHREEALLGVLDAKSLRQRGGRVLAELRLSALIAYIHGRSYCAADGLFCAARGHASPADSATNQCVTGLACFDRSYPRVDPRRYDTPVLVMDGCNAANLTADHLIDGLPSLAFLALDGAPSAVIASDGLVMAGGGAVFAPLDALATSETMGAAVNRLNDLRKAQSGPLSYLLLGDPEIVAGRRRWPTWAASAKVTDGEVDGHMAVRRRGRLFAPASRNDAPLLSADLPPAAPGWITYVWSSEAERLPVAELVHDERRSRLWLGVEPSEFDSVQVAQAPPPRLVDNLRSAAARAPLRTRDWKPPLTATAEAIHDAGTAMLRTERAGESLQGQAVIAPPAALQSQAGDALDAWQFAHAAAVRALVDRAARHALWPSSLWDIIELQSEMTGRACEICGRTSTIDRSYRTLSRRARQWWECRRCEITRDLATDDELPWMELEAPADIAPGPPTSATLRLRTPPSAGPALWIGAVAVTVERRGHGVEVQPRLHPVRLREDAQEAFTFTLRIVGNPPVPQYYRLRALAVVNTEVLWVGRMVRVGSPG